MNTEFSIDPAAMLSKVFAFHAGQPQTRQANLSVRTIPDDDAPVQPKDSCTDAAARLMSTSCAARYLGTSVWTIRRMFFAGELRGIRGKHLKFDKRDLDEYIEANKEQFK